MTDTSNHLDALIVGNLSDLAGAMQRLEEIQNEVGRAINKTVREWCDAQTPKWNLEHETLDEDGLELYPDSWKLGNGEAENSSTLANIWIALEDEDKDWRDHLWLANLCSVANSKPFNVLWHPDYHVIIPGKGSKKNRWREFVTNGEWVSRLRSLGYSYSDQTGGFFRPFIISKEELAQAIKDNAIEEAFSPLHEALEGLNKAKAIFDEILEAAKKEFSFEN